MKEPKTKEERSKKKLKEVNEQELQRVMGGAIGCGECLCGSSAATRSSYDVGCVC